MINLYLNEKDGLAEESPGEKSNGNGGHAKSNPGTAEKERNPSEHTLKIGDLCPECGEAAVVNEEGCRKCYACGYSEC